MFRFDELHLPQGIKLFTHFLNKHLVAGLLDIVHEWQIKVSSKSLLMLQPCLYIFTSSLLLNVCFCPFSLTLIVSCKSNIAAFNSLLTYLQTFDFSELHNSTLMWLSKVFKSRGLYGTIHMLSFKIGFCSDPITTSKLQSYGFLLL